MPPAGTKMRHAGRPVCVDGHVGQVAVVQSGTLELLVLEVEAERLDQVQAGAGIRREADDVAGVGRDLRMDEDDVEHGRWVVFWGQSQIARRGELGSESNRVAGRTGVRVKSCGGSDRGQSHTVPG